jgi:hypothetical protein
MEAEPASEMLDDESGHDKLSWPSDYVLRIYQIHAHIKKQMKLYLCLGLF